MLLTPKIRQADISYYAGIVLMRKALAAVVFFLFTLAALLYFLFAPGVYRTAACFFVETTDISFSLAPGKGLSLETRPSNIADHAKFLESRTLAESVAKKLGLKDASALLKKVNVSIPKNSANVVLVEVKGKNPAEITDIANTWVEAFREQNAAVRRNVVKEGETLIAGGIDSALKDLQKAESKVSDFELGNPGISQKAGLMDELERRRQDIESRISGLSMKYKEGHPSVTALKESLENTRKMILDERKAMEADWDKVQEYRRLRDEAGTYRKLYDGLAESAREFKAAVSFAPSNVQVIDKAAIPLKPIPKYDGALKILFLGLLVAIGACYVEEYFDHTLAYPEQVDFYLKMPALAEIPSCKGDDVFKMAFNDPTSLGSEAFRNLKVFFFFAAPEGVHLNTVIVGSCFPGEGKTFAASNLAIIFARGGEKTLLIDADMRKGVLDEVYGAAGARGLSEILAGEAQPAGAFLNTSVPNLSLLPSGKHVINPEDFLKNKDSLKGVMDAARGAGFKRIVIDVPAMLKHPDMLFWQENCDAVICVIEKRGTPFEKIIEARKRFFKGDKTMIGAALNDKGRETLMEGLAKRALSIFKKKA